MLWFNLEHVAYIFLDESGDLGFDFSKARTSKFFIITCLFTQNKRVIEKVVSKVHKTLRKSYRQKSGVLHCHEEKPITRKRLLRLLVQKDCSIMTVWLNKNKVYTKLQNEKDILYNYVTNILLDRIYTRKLVPISDELILIASRKETNKFLNLNFASYLGNSIKQKHKLNIRIVLKTPHEEKSLQAADFVSWSIFRKYEYGDESYYRIIKSNIVEENPLFGQL